MKDIKQVAQDAVKAQIGSNKEHGWGSNDSMAVIDVIVAEDASNSAEAGETLEKYSLSEEASKWIKRLINPSAFRQELESSKLLNKSEGRKSKSEKLFASFTE